MVSPHGIKLAVHLISAYFGDIVSKVCECLLRNGTLSLQQVLRFTELNKENATNALLVLIQHNCVQAFSIEQQGGFMEQPKMVTHYMALHDNIIHLMRFSKFLAIISDEFGQECMEIFEGLLQHGRLSMNQIVDRYKDKHKSHTSKENSTAANVAHENFNKLAQAHYIERCPASEPYLESEKEDDTAGKKKTAKSKTNDPSQTLEARALAAATPMESIRFLVEADTFTNGAPDENTKKTSTTEIVGEKRKKIFLEPENKEILWRVNFEEFVRHFRHKCCITHMTTRMDNVAGIVLSAIFEATRRDETKVKMENTVPLPMDRIYEEAIKREEGRSLSLERVRDSLVQLGCEVPIIGLDETYSIDLKKIIDEAQAQEVESVVLKKYGREAYRIFRLLLQSKRLCETDQIWMATFVDKKDALKILFQLWKDDLLHMERVANEGQKLESLCWKLNKVSVWEQVLDDMYHAALNLKLRLVHELEQAKEILRKGKSVGDQVLAKRKKVGEKWEVLDSSLMILDDAIMLFHDF
ncbi:uncharacterized protein LOC111900785 isoform X1 [Lactuca sativa]|uniref:DNA-directed RNA polymerase III subunit RPC3 n=1 Tax=Lactuca sativa TaxID=4236 RepID=A0A9R1UR80_LACSA|nr:uncharacterized protein LOC111900785 isoform X1 [Lactuca sativa]KAJ0191819.1 hypothetical protein LSAT_V11C800392010 [Lactuca sativa]